MINNLIVNNKRRYLHEVSYEINPLYNRYRLDRYLKIKMPWYSISELNLYIQNGEFLKNGKTIKKGDKLHSNDTLTRIYYRDEPYIDQSIIDIETVYEDDELLVVNKPPTIPVHPNSAYQSGTMLQILEEKYAYKNLRLVHRLDKETSGLILLAKNKEMAAFLTKKLSYRNVEKRYLAFVNGTVKEKFFTVKFNLGIDKNSKIRLKQGEVDDGLFSHTEFTLLKQYKDYALVEALLKTGRQHQIRAHLSSYGNYIIGDKIYGVDEMIFDEFVDKGLTPQMHKILEIDHHLLHAYKLSFYDEKRDKFFSFKAKLPKDFSNFIKTKL
jgi:23S rRNA pseudouridine1911/1915/1917 synthase